MAQNSPKMDFWEWFLKIELFLGSVFKNFACERRQDCLPLPLRLLLALPVSATLSTLVSWRMRMCSSFEETNKHVSVGWSSLFPTHGRVYITTGMNYFRDVTIWSCTRFCVRSCVSFFIVVFFVMDQQQRLNRMCWHRWRHAEKPKCAYGL